MGSRISKAQLLLPTVSLLQNHIGKENRISVKEVCSKHEQNFNKRVSRNTMGELLKQLNEEFDLGGQILCFEGKSENRNYNYGYYYKPYVSQEELQLIVDDIKTSEIHSEEKAELLIKKLLKMFPESIKISESKFYNMKINGMTKDLETNIATINKIIQKNKKDKNGDYKIKFIMQGYDAEGKVFETDKKHEILPIAIGKIDNHFYLLGHKEFIKNKDNNSISIYRLDLIKLVEEVYCTYAVNNKKIEQLKNKLRDGEILNYISQHKYSSYGETKTYVLRAKSINGSFSYVMDLLQPSFEMRKIGDEAEFMYTCPPRTMEILLRQYMGFLKVIGPEKDKQEIEKKMISELLKVDDYKKVILELLSDNKQ